MVSRAFLLSVLLALAGAAAPASAQTLTGVVSVLDGDTLEMHGQRIRLFGIDAPEGRQTCALGGQDWRCGRTAALALSDLIGRSTVACEQRDIDRYKRIVAVCRLGDVDLGAWMVRNGWAVAYTQYSRDYVGLEKQAEREQQGIWASQFERPASWRRSN